MPFVYHLEVQRIISPLRNRARLCNACWGKQTNSCFFMTYCFFPASFKHRLLRFQNLSFQNNILQHSNAGFQGKKIVQPKIKNWHLTLISFQTPVTFSILWNIMRIGNGNFTKYLRVKCQKLSWVLKTWNIACMDVV